MSRYRPLSDIRRLVIHCAATPAGAPFTAADIDQWHQQRKFRRSQDARHGLGRWQGLGPHGVALVAIGYHFVIRVNGVVEIGRRLTETGAHEETANADSIGVCLIGTDQFSARQWEVLRKHVISTQAWRKRAGFPPVEIVGHRMLDTGRTCPGFDVPAWLDGDMQPLAGHILDESA